VGVEGDQRELIAADPCHECAVGRSRETARDTAQQFVARRVSEHVIDLLEAVEIERDDRKGFRRRGGTLQRR